MVKKGEYEPAKGPTPTTKGLLSNPISTDFIDSVEIHFSYEDTDFLRRVLFPGKEYFVFWDDVKGANEENLYDWLFHSPIPAGREQIIIENSKVSWPAWDIYNDVATDVQLDIFFASPVELSYNYFSKWVPIYKWKYQGTNKEGLIASKFEASTSLLTVLYPYKVGEGAPSFTQLDVKGGEGILLNTAKGETDLILGQGKDGYLEVEGLKTDATTVLLRKDKSENGYKFLSMHNGKTFELNGKVIIESSNKLTITLNVTSQGAIAGWINPKEGLNTFKVKIYVPSGNPERVTLCGEELSFEYDAKSNYLSVDINAQCEAGEFKVFFKKQKG